MNQLSNRVKAIDSREVAMMLEKEHADVLKEIEGRKMGMTELEKKLHHARKNLNEVIHQLANTAIEDSESYHSAIQKLKDFRWKFTGESSSMMIDLAIEIIKERALNASTKKNSN